MVIHKQHSMSDMNKQGQTGGAAPTEKQQELHRMNMLANNKMTKRKKTM